jgi:CheY-like chemotaxis protein
MGGSIGVTSGLGLGSTFWFEIELEISPSAADLKGDLAGVHVLVVDDNAISRAYLSSLLTSWGASITQAASAIEALAQLRASGERITFALIDHQMPEMDGIQLVSAIHSDLHRPDLRIVLLSSMADRLSNERPAGAAISHYLAKPVRRGALLRVFSPPTIEEPVSKTFQVRAGSLRPILIAEDNDVNARLTLRLVEQLGYRADLVGTGTAAVVAHKARRYSAILMDCQMPEMDGYEATRLIRAQEGDSARIPIIALTAHAMKGDRENCLVAGMDDYLPKPLKVQDLASALARWIQRVPDPCVSDTDVASKECALEQSRSL